MRARTVFRAATLTLLAALLTASGLAAAEPRTDADRAQRRESRLQQTLNLTDEQLQAFRQLHATRDVEAHRRQHRALRAAETELRRLALNGTDEATLAAKQAEIQALRAQQLQQRVAALRQIGPILTAEQREAFATMLERGGHGRHHRPHGPRQQT